MQKEVGQTPNSMELEKEPREGGFEGWVPSLQAGFPRMGARGIGVCQCPQGAGEG